MRNFMRLLDSTAMLGNGLGPRGMAFQDRRLYCQHRTRGLSQDRFGNASHQHTTYPRSAVCAHDKQIGFRLLCDVYDCSRGIPVFQSIFNDYGAATRRLLMMEAVHQGLTDHCGVRRGRLVWVAEHHIRRLDMQHEQAGRRSPLPRNKPARRRPRRERKSRWAEESFEWAAWQAPNDRWLRVKLGARTRLFSPPRQDPG